MVRFQPGESRTHGAVIKANDIDFIGKCHQLFNFIEDFTLSINLLHLISSSPLASLLNPNVVR